LHLIQKLIVYNPHSNRRKKTDFSANFVKVQVVFLLKAIGDV